MSLDGLEAIVEAIKDVRSYATGYPFDSQEDYRRKRFLVSYIEKHPEDWEFVFSCMRYKFRDIKSRRQAADSLGPSIQVADSRFEDRTNAVMQDEVLTSVINMRVPQAPAPNGD